MAPKRYKFHQLYATCSTRRKAGEDACHALQPLRSTAGSSDGSAARACTVVSRGSLSLTTTICMRRLHRAGREEEGRIGWHWQGDPIQIRQLCNNHHASVAASILHSLFPAYDASGGAGQGKQQAGFGQGRLWKDIPAGRTKDLAAPTLHRPCT